MLDKNLIGTKSEPLSVDVEKGQLRFFAKATGESNPVYINEDAAKEAGYRSLLAPPTFAFSLNLARPDPFAHFIKLGIDLNKVLHGGQEFEYSGDICSGDTIRLEETLVDIYDKKGGALEFLVFETVGTNQHDDVVVKMKSTIVVRN